MWGLLIRWFGGSFKILIFATPLFVGMTLGGVAVFRPVAERLPQFPGLGDLGLLESNGAQNYRNWEKMLKDVPQGGIFGLKRKTK